MAQMATEKPFDHVVEGDVALEQMGYEQGMIFLRSSFLSSPCSS